MKITMIGVGYVGIVSGICFAETGNEVYCMDVDNNKIDKLNNQELFLYEPGLNQFFLRNIKEKRLFFTTDLQKAIDHADIIFLALPTPAEEDGSSDLRYVLDLAEQIGKRMKTYKIIVNKSTVPVGTARLVEEKIKQNYSGKFDVVSNPEFLREGNAVEDFMKPSRIIIGSSSAEAIKVMTSLYEPYTHRENHILAMDTQSAELSKYAANAFLAAKISFMNELAIFSESTGASIDSVRKAMGLDERIGSAFLYAGIGYGGSCFPKDVSSLIHQMKQSGEAASIAQSTRDVNDRQILFFMQKIERYFSHKLEGKRFGIWGLSFKPNTDDIRESPALKCIDYLLGKSCAISVFDPEAMLRTKDMYKDKIAYKEFKEEVADDVDALIIATEWREFSLPDFSLLRKRMKAPVIFDGRNIFSIKKMMEQDFDYISIGRNAVYNYSKKSI